MSVEIENYASDLENVHVPRNEVVPGYITKFYVTLATESTGSWLLFAPVQNSTISTFSYGEITTAGFDFTFRQLKSTNVENNNSKVKSCPSMYVGMANSLNTDIFITLLVLSYLGKRKGSSQL